MNTSRGIASRNPARFYLFPDGAATELIDRLVVVTIAHALFVELAQIPRAQRRDVEPVD